MSEALLPPGAQGLIGSTYSHPVSAELHDAEQFWMAPTSAVHLIPAVRSAEVRVSP